MPDTPALDLDAALSADLDGDLAGFIADAGLPAAVVHSALVAPDAISRRAEIERARAELASPVAPVDDVTRRRLLAGASAGTSGGNRANSRESSGSELNRRRWATGLAAAAIAGVALIGTGIFLGTRDPGGGDASSRATGAPSAAAKNLSGDLGDLGSLDQQGIDGLAGQDATDDTGSVTADEAPGNSESEAWRSTQRSAAAPGASATPEQVQACRDYYRSRGQVRFTASVTYAGRPAAVVGIGTGDGNGARTVVFVVAAENCSEVLYSASTGG